MSTISNALEMPLQEDKTPASGIIRWFHEAALFFSEKAVSLPLLDPVLPKDESSEVNYVSDNTEPLENSYVNTLNNAKSILPNQIREKVIDRIEYIYQICKSDPHEVEISLLSLKYFLNFINNINIKNITYPSIAKSYDGNIYIEWREQKKYLIGFEFFENGEIGYTIILTTEPNDEYSRINIIGRSKLIDVLKVIESNHIKDLISI